jgi:hypothetical protein
MLVLFVKKFYTFYVIARGVSPARPAVSHRRALGTNGGDPGQESNLIFGEKYLLNARLLRTSSRCPSGKSARNDIGQIKNCVFL